LVSVVRQGRIHSVDLLLIPTGCLQWRLDAALRLPEEDRLAIVSRLLESLPDSPPGWSVDDPEFDAELERRSGDWEGAVPWEQLRDEPPRSS
jgi:hypothetical protein